MGRCGACRWWRNDDIDAVVASPGHAADTAYARGWGACLLTSSNGNEPEPHPQTLAFASDEDDYASILLTAPTFGCVQFAARPEDVGYRTIAIEHADYTVSYRVRTHG